MLLNCCWTCMGGDKINKELLCKCNTLQPCSMWRLTSCWQWNCGLSVSSPFYDSVNLLWFLLNHRVNGCECNSTLSARTMPGVRQQACPGLRSTCYCCQIGFLLSFLLFNAGATWAQLRWCMSLCLMLYVRMSNNCSKVILYACEFILVHSILGFSLWHY